MLADGGEVAGVASLRRRERDCMSWRNDAEWRNDTTRDFRLSGSTFIRILAGGGEVAWVACARLASSEAESGVDPDAHAARPDADAGPDVACLFLVMTCEQLVMTCEQIEIVGCGGFEVRVST